MLKNARIEKIWTQESNFKPSGFEGQREVQQDWKGRCEARRALGASRFSGCSPRSEIVPLRINDHSSTNPEVAASLNSDRGKCLIVLGGSGTLGERAGEDER